MKSKALILNSLIIGVVVLLLYSGCVKQKSECMQSDLPPDTNVYFEYRDKQGRDLLNSATPGHYDAALITQLNAGNVTVYTPPSFTTGFIAIKGTIAPTTRFISLSATDQDTLFTAGTTVTTPCDTYTTINDIKYNGTPALKGNQFTIYK